MRFQVASILPRVPRDPSDPRVSTGIALAAIAAFAFAACSTAPTAPEATAPAAAEVPAAPKTLAEEAAAVVKDLRTFSVHSYDADVHAKIPPALVFLAAHAGDVSNKTALAEVKSNVIRTSIRAKDLDIAQPVARELLGGDDPRLGFKVDAAEYLALGALRTNDYATADALYKAFWTLPTQGAGSISWGERSRVAALRAALFTRRNDMAGALKVIADARAENPYGQKPEDYGNTLWRGLLDEEAVKIYKEFFRFKEAFDYALSKGRRDLALRLVSDGLVDDVPGGLKAARELLADEKEQLYRRAIAWNWLFDRDRAMADKYFPEMLGKSTRETNNVLAMLKYRMTQGGAIFGNGTPAFYSDNAETVRVWELYDKLLKMTGGVAEFQPAQYAVAAYAGLGQMQKAVAAAKAGLGNDKLKPEERYELELASRTLALGQSGEALVAALAAADRAAAEAAPGLTGKDRLARLERVGAMALASGVERLARGFADYRLAVKPKLPKMRYVAKFSKRPVGGAHDWGNIPFRPEEQSFTRKYGGSDDLSFMLTDVATGDRGNAVKGGRAEHPTTLQAVADEWGIHVLLSFYDGRAREFEAGSLDAGSYECYIAPGANQPYTCFLCYPKKDAQAYIYSTSYNGPGHRRVDDKNPAKFRSETLFTDDRILNYVGFSWDNFATLVPTKGSEWDFECVFWGPVPSAWNGTESIHGRSTWGILSFDLTDADRARILRAQIFKAANAYKAEKVARNAGVPGGQESVFDFWQDAELGDPAFYEAVVKPLEERLDTGLEKVKVGMSDEDVADVAQNYLQEWRDVRFTIDRLRAAYLSERLSEEGQ